MAKRFTTALIAATLSTALPLPLPLLKEEAIVTLYSSLDKGPFLPLLAFYVLYPTHPKGCAARDELIASIKNPSLASKDLRPLAETLLGVMEPSCRLALGEKDTFASALQWLGIAAADFPSRRLKGAEITSRAELEALPSDEIDIGRALLIEELSPDAWPLYEGQLDLMALQIAALLPPHATGKDKVAAINSYLFTDLGFRFPPLSSYSTHIDRYTSLHSVLDTRRGVCLGITLLYYCLAQRLSLPLEIITPPGHIFLRYREGEITINIETTAGGIDLPDEKYLGLALRYLTLREPRELIGLAHMNMASTALINEDYTTALSHYMRASLFMKESQILLELTALCHLLLDAEEKAQPFLIRAMALPLSETVSPSTLASDLYHKAIDAKGLCLLLTPIGKERPDRQRQCEQLKELLKSFPRFRAGWLQLAEVSLELNSIATALKALESYYALDDSDPHIAYLLSQLSLKRYNYKDALKYYLIAYKLCADQNHFPKPLRELKFKIMQHCFINNHGLDELD